MTSAMVDSSHIDLWRKVKVTSPINDKTPHENIKFCRSYRTILTFSCNVINDGNFRKYTDSYIGEGHRSK